MTKLEKIKRVYSQVTNPEYKLTICTKNGFSAYIKKDGDFTPIRISDHCTGRDRASEEVQFSIFTTEKMGKTQSYNDICKGKLSRKKEIYQYEFFLLQNYQPFTKSKRKFY